MATTGHSYRWLSSGNQREPTRSARPISSEALQFGTAPFGTVDAFAECDRSEGKASARIASRESREWHANIVGTRTRPSYVQMLYTARAFGIDGVGQ